MAREEADLVVNKHLDHVSQSITKLKVIVARVTKLIEGEFNCSFDAKLDLFNRVQYRNNKKKTAIRANRNKTKQGSQNTPCRPHAS